MWNFIVERAPSWGGFWERLVCSVKRPLKKVIGKSSLSVDELQTILTEIEAVINARPITYVYGDDESISNPLTPADLIYGRPITSATSDSKNDDVEQTIGGNSKNHGTDRDGFDSFTNCERPRQSAAVVGELARRLRQ